MRLSPLNVSGGFLLGLGIILLLYSIAANSIGLIHDQRNGIIFGAFLVVDGVVLLIISYLRGELGDLGSTTPPGDDRK